MLENHRLSSAALKSHLPQSDPTAATRFIKCELIFEHEFCKNVAVDWQIALL